VQPSDMAGTRAPQHSGILTLHTFRQQEWERLARKNTSNTCYSVSQKVVCHGYERSCLMVKRQPLPSREELANKIRKSCFSQQVL
jgi:hypothetical protein